MPKTVDIWVISRYDYFVGEAHGLWLFQTAAAGLPRRLFLSFVAAVRRIPIDQSRLTPIYLQKDGYDMSNNTDILTEEWGELICALPAVEDCRIVLEEGKLTELHVLANDSRSPKQIVRDIQSAMMARYKYPVDHRLISVAQIPGPDKAQRRLVLSQMNISIGREGAEVTVALSLDGRQSEARALCGLTRTDRRRAVAKATVEAISPFLPAGEQLWLSDVERASLSGKDALLVGVTLFTSRGSEELIGAAFEKSDADLTVAHAALDAVNRRLRFYGNPQK